MNRLALIACVSVIVYTAAIATEREFPPYPEKGLKGLVTPERLPQTDYQIIQLGAEVWAGTCKVCHGGGLAGSPKITGSKFWSDRISQGLDTLIEHATNGYQSKSGGYMPARGGNDTLTDTEVEAAVRFMVYHSGGRKVALEKTIN